MSVGSINSAETYTPENGIAPTISGKDTFNQVLIITGRLQMKMKQYQCRRA